LHEDDSAGDDRNVLQAIELRDGVLLLAGGLPSPMVRTAKRTDDEPHRD
jgi:hypothetical protein